MAERYSDAPERCPNTLSMAVQITLYMLRLWCAPPNDIPFISPTIRCFIIIIQLVTYFASQSYRENPLTHQTLQKHHGNKELKSPHHASYSLKMGRLNRFQSHNALSTQYRNSHSMYVTQLNYYGRRIPYLIRHPTVQFRDRCLLDLVW
jgi:hypothetical protein